MSIRINGLFQTFSKFLFAVFFSSFVSLLQVLIKMKNVFQSKHSENCMGFFMICTNITSCNRVCILVFVHMYYTCKICMYICLIENVIIIQCALQLIELQKDSIRRQHILKPSIIICDVHAKLGSCTFNTFVCEN